ncbi:MAG TPA: LiaF-related protein [Chitinophagaceae bacterium]|nr:LiaF-related protein [Chitinophagaceae bacterium]
MSEHTGNQHYDRESRRERRRANAQSEGHIWTGIFLLLIGGVALAKSLGADIPRWIFSWQMLLIGIGLFIGFRNSFRDGAWFILIIIGGLFLVNDYFLMGDLRKHIWPLALIVLGVFFVFRSRKKGWMQFQCDKKEEPGTGPATDTTAAATASAQAHFSDDDVIDTTSIFGGTKKIILSKNFRGGEMINIFGGSELDLTQADMQAPAVLEITALFGGATLVVPSNWAIKSEAFTLFGGISDKRKIGPLTDSAHKTIILKGTMIFGGLEIKSY